jgi:hypothetical protein
MEMNGIDLIARVAAHLRGGYRMQSLLLRCHDLAFHPRTQENLSNVSQEREGRKKTMKKEYCHAGRETCGIAKKPSQACA